MWGGIFKERTGWGWGLGGDYFHRDDHCTYAQTPSARFDGPPKNPPGGDRRGGILGVQNMSLGGN